MKLLMNVVLCAIVILSCSARSIEEKSDGKRVKRNLLLDPATRWFLPADGPLVEFDIAPAAPGAAIPTVAISPARQRTIRRALNFIQTHTCLEFARNRIAAAAGRKRMLFRQLPVDPANTICHVSSIGSADGQDTIITIHPSCADQVPLIVRLIMHALGFHSMAARPDAAQHLSISTTVVTNASITGDESVFAKIADGETDVTAAISATLPPFEFGSILMYSPTELTDGPRYNASAADAIFQGAMGSGRDTFNDLKMINDAYCANSFPGTTLSCNHGGYLAPPDCDICTCPHGYAGEECNDLPDGHVSNRTQGQILPATANFQRRFIEFGQDPTTGTRNEFIERVDWITAPRGRRIEARVVDMFLQCNPGCKTAGVEIKVSRTLAGARICCPDMINVTITAPRSPMPIISYNRFSFTSFFLEYRFGNEFNYETK